MERDREVLPGNVTDVERVGQTVRRATSPGAERVHQVLLHLERVGFEGAPRFIGTEGDREVLSFIPGDVPAYHEKGSVSTAGLQSLGALLRGLDDALDSLPVPAESSGLRWRHGDASLGNCVFDGDRAVAFIDFDYVRPLPALWDLHRCAWQSAPLADPESCAAMGVAPEDIAPRLAAFVSGYRPSSVAGFAEHAAECVREFLDKWEGSASVPRIVERQLAWIEANAAAVDAAAARGLSGQG